MTISQSVLAQLAEYCTAITEVSGFKYFTSLNF